MSGTRLIVHADDLGLSEAVNRAVIAAHRNGIVTAASVMASAAAFDHAMTLAATAPTLDIGVHLTLTEEQPVTDPKLVPSLVGGAGRFRASVFELAGAALRGRIDLADVRRELDAQIRRVAERGLPISHLDGHQHIHVLPGIARVVAELAREHGIPAVRLPAERVRPYMLRDVGRSRRVVEQLALNAACAAAPFNGLKRTDHFAGFHFGGRLNETNLLVLLQHMPRRGTIELMCHPGDEDPDDPYEHWHYARSEELEALSSGRVRQWLTEHSVELVSYRDLI